MTDLIVPEVGAEPVSEWHAPRAGRVVFLDTETTGLDPATEELFEIAVIDGQTGEEHLFHIEPLPEVVAAMHPKAVEVNRYHERTSAPGWAWDSPHQTADRLERILTGAHIVGAVPDFDARFLAAFYKSLGYPVPRWHYHLIDIENVAYGWLLQEPLTAQSRHVLATLPLDSNALSQMCGVAAAPDDERHTALGDARWVARWWNRLHGRPVPLHPGPATHSAEWRDGASGAEKATAIPDGIRTSLDAQQPGDVA